MSMHFNGEFGYGLFLNPDEVSNFVKAYAKKNALDEDDEDELADIPWNIDASNLNDDEYDMRCVGFLDRKKHDETDDDFVNGWFVYAEKQGSPFREENESDTYRNKEELTNPTASRGGCGNTAPSA